MFSPEFFKFLLVFTGIIVAAFVVLVYLQGGVVG
jgi:hypothetical protein